jgi:Family of unknown function (DUF6459)
MSLDATEGASLVDSAAEVAGAGPGGRRALLSPIAARAIPDLSPPTIDSRAPVLQDPSPFIQGALAMDFRGGYVAGQDPPAPQDAELAEDPEDPEYFGPQRTFSRDLPEPRAWVRHMAQALIEVMAGARPAPQVIRWTTPEVYSVVARRSAVSGRGPVVARRALVRRVRTCEPADGVVEACAVVVDNGRVRALAMRLTGIDGRWVVSELQVG